MIRHVLLLLVAVAIGQTACTQPAPEIVRDCPTCPEMVRISAGSFTMGSSEAESTRFEVNGGNTLPQHRVTFARDFWFGRNPVTREEFAAFVSATNYRSKEDCVRFALVSKAGSWRAPGFRQTTRDPVVCVNVDDAEAYTDWLSQKTGKTYRLPSEAEWEYAARAGTTTAFYWGDSATDICRYANIGDQALKKAYGKTFRAVACDDGYAFTAPVGSFPSNPWGLHDMAGNVWQWTADCYVRDYSGAPTDGSAWKIGPADCRPVVRGGSWNFEPLYARAGVRASLGGADRNPLSGFRLARAN